MKHYKDEEIIEKFREIWKPRTLDKVCIDLNTEKKVQVTISNMYEAPGLNLSILKQISEYFGTDNIDDERFSSSGCETCDYGSDYGFTLTIYE